MGRRVYLSPALKPPSNPVEALKLARKQYENLRGSQRVVDGAAFRAMASVIARHHAGLPQHVIGVDVVLKPSEWVQAAITVAGLLRSDGLAKTRTYVNALRSAELVCLGTPEP